MTSLMDAWVTVKPDMDKFGPEVKKKLSNIDTASEGKKVAGRFGVGFNGAFGGIVKHSAGLFVAGFAAIKGAQVFGGFINDARESAKVARVSAQVIKSTGGIAGITAKSMGDLATAISNKTGADDEAIQSGENLLATFTNVRNGVGKGNKIFDQATQAAVDMASAMNNGVVDANGLKAANIQLGKALNDPVKGVTALSKVGVSFTADQKKQIKTLVESGNTLKAQKIILGEVGKEFGGAAAAASDPLTRLKTIAGNLGEKVGGYLLPTVDKFTTFLGDKAAPAISDLFDKLSTFTQSKGFQDFLADARAKAVALFAYVQTDVLPRLKELGGFLLEKVVPALGKMAEFVGRNKDFFIPFGIALGTIVAGVRAFAVAQGILNAVMAVNPIGLVVIAIAGLAAGLIYTYKHSDKFREIVDKAFKVVKAAAVIMWDNYLKPMFAAFVLVLKTLWEQAQTFATNVNTAWNAIKEPARAAFAFVVEKFLDLVGSLVHGAAEAFGWVPGIGEKLKTADKAFETFKKNVNDSLAGINDQTVTVTAKLNSSNINSKNANDRRLANVGMAAGGGVFGGTRGRDSVPALLMPDEHVWTTKEVSAAGGHGAMKRLRNAALQGELRGFAAGGSPRLKFQQGLPSASAQRVFASEIASHAIAAVMPTAQQLANNLAAAGGPAGPPGSVHSFRGEKLNDRTIGMLLRAEKLLGHAFRIMQGSYSTRVAASGGTHAGGGVMDTDGPGGWNNAVSALRRVGFAAWHRTPAQGPWGHHIHSVAIGDSTESGAAKRQVQSYLRGGDGLGHGMAAGGSVGDFLKSIPKYDRGGQWPTGTFGVNTSGKTETVVPGNGEVRLDDHTLAALERSQEKAMVRALQKGQLRMVSAGGGSYVLQMSNG